VEHSEAEVKVMLQYIPVETPRPCSTHITDTMVTFVFAVNFHIREYTVHS
jgi:hypothetical protein